jgi:hypothetical protein
MFADISQEVDVRQLREPVGIVGEDGTGRGIVETQELPELFFDSFDIFCDLLGGEEFSFDTFAARIADHPGRPADKGDRTVSELLEPAQVHQGNEMSDVEAVGSRIEADVNGSRLFQKPTGKRLGTGHLMNQSPPCKFLNNILHRATLGENQL